ncbi:MAG TPA: response regulator transcription factor [Bacillota bacterium]|nr:response regulator transcription factor [Bacillota bacterium]
MLKILLAEDQVLLRESLKVLLEQEDDLQVVGCASNGREAFELCESLAPDIVLMDILMPECDGVEGTRLIKAKYGSIKVLILTTFDNQENVYAALQSGADGYILKEISSKDLVLAIRNTAKGFGIIHKKTYDQIVNHFQSHTTESSTSGNPVVNLSERELQIIRWIVEGKSSREIADILYLGEGRVKNIITELLKKLNVKDRVQLVVYAIKNNLIT